MSTLREVRRQREGWDRQALDALRSGEVEVWARAYRDHGRITIADTAPATRTALVNDWARATGDKLMIAARREDVVELNYLARRHLQRSGQLPPDAIVVAGRALTTGDRIVGARNDRKAGILNGQRGTVTACDSDQRLVEVTLDGGRRVHLTADYLEAGHLEHGYAITAHRAQGATVDRTFVLGGEELYREWGYTALSRHRTEARFYIAQGDVRQDPQLPPAHDALIAGITRLLERSNLKSLAVDSLPAEQREELEQQRRALRDQLRGDPLPLPPTPQPTERERQRTERATEDILRRESVLRQQLEELGWRDRKQRPRLEFELQQTVELQRRRQERAFSQREEGQAAAADTQQWIERNAAPAAQLLAVVGELSARDALDDRVRRRLKEHHRDPLELGHQQQQLRVHDHGRDL